MPDLHEQGSEPHFHNGIGPRGLIEAENLKVQN